jgi:hypothetical protein
MGRTLPSASQVFQIEEKSFARFRRALRRTDQLALDELFNFAQAHVAEAGYAAHPLPMEIYLLAMLLEEHKQVVKLREQVKVFNALVEHLKSLPNDQKEEQEPQPQKVSK